MSDQLPIPPELQHLIEKRDDDDPRTIDRRVQKDRRTNDGKPDDCTDTIDGTRQIPQHERRSGQDRRADREKRKGDRRDTNSDSAQ